MAGTTRCRSRPTSARGSRHRMGQRQGHVGTGDLTFVSNPYPTSWNYGGGNRTVDTADEASEVEMAIEAASDADKPAMWAGLAPADRQMVSEFTASGDSGPDDLAGGANLDEVTGSAAVTVPDPAYNNSIPVGPCGALNTSKGITRDKPGGAPAPGPASRLSPSAGDRPQAVRDPLGQEDHRGHPAPGLGPAQPASMPVWRSRPGSESGRRIAHGHTRRRRNVTRSSFERLCRGTAGRALGL